MSMRRMRLSLKGTTFTRSYLIIRRLKILEGVWLMVGSGVVFDERLVGVIVFEGKILGGSKESENVLGADESIFGLIEVDGIA